ncbi:hypothetical protein TKK_0007794 [Trichogramma kaykai]
MAPTKKPAPEKRPRKVLNIAMKLKILDMLNSGEKFSFVAKKFSVNESTIRCIRDSAENIRETASKSGSQVKSSKVHR